MKQYRIDIKPTAENDLIRRYRQIAEDSSQNALQWYLQIIDAIEKLDILAERCPVAPEDADIQTFMNRSLHTPTVCKQARWGQISNLSPNLHSKKEYVI